MLAIEKSLLAISVSSVLLTSRIFASCADFPPPPYSSFPRKRESRASDGAVALDSRFRGNDTVER